MNILEFIPWIFMNYSRILMNYSWTGKSKYLMIYSQQVKTEEVHDLFNVGSSQKVPLLSKLDHHTVLVGYDYKSVIFDNSQGQPRKDFYLMWSNVPHYIGNLSHLMTKPTKWSVCPVKTHISLGICPVWSVFAVCSLGSWGPNISLFGQQRHWSDWAVAQAELSLLGTQVILLVLSWGGSFCIC